MGYIGSLQHSAAGLFSLPKAWRAQSPCRFSCRMWAHQARPIWSRSHRSFTEHAGSALRHVSLLGSPGQWRDCRSHLQNTRRNPAGASRGPDRKWARPKLPAASRAHRLALNYEHFARSPCAASCHGSQSFTMSHPLPTKAYNRSSYALFS